MTKRRVPLWGKPQGYVSIDDAATDGAVLGENLRWPNGELVKKEELAGSAPVEDENKRTLWTLLLQVPANVVALAKATGSGFFAVKSDGTGAFRSIVSADDDRILVTHNSGETGDPTIDLAPVTDAGGGTLQKTDIDGFGRVIGTSAATTTDLAEGTNLYFTAARADARVLVGIDAHEAASDPHTQYLTVEEDNEAFDDNLALLYNIAKL